MRTRHDINVSYLTHTETVVSCANVTTVTDHGSHPNLRNGSQRSMTDVVTKRFRERSARGEVINTPMSMSDEWFSSTTQLGGWALKPGKPCTIGKSRRKHAWGSGYFQQPVTFSRLQSNDPIISALIAEAMADARASIEEPVLMSLVELVEARKLLTSLAKNTHNFAREMKRVGRSAAFAAWLRKRGLNAEAGLNPKLLVMFIAENWLTYRYLFTPIYLSARDVIADMSLKAPQPERETYRAKKLDTQSNSWTSFNEDSSWIHNGSYSQSSTVEVRAGILTELIRDLAVTSRYGMELKHLPASAWELLPWSFVLDWFLNVGTYIQAHQPLVGRRVLTSWVTVTEVSTFTMSHQATGKVSTDYDRFPCLTTHARGCMYKKRIPLPNVSLTLRHADVNLTTFWKRFGDAVAFLALVAGGRGNNQNRNNRPKG